MSTETCAQMQTKLTGYLAARDKVVTTGGIVRVRDGVSELQYGPADVKRLDILIREVRLHMERQRCAGCRRRGGITYLTPSG